MALDPNIPLSGQQIKLPDPLEQAARAYSLKSMQEASQMHGMQMQHMNLQNQHMQNTLANEEAFNKGLQITPDGKVDYSGSMPNMTGQNKLKLAQMQREQQTADARSQEQAAKTQMEIMNVAGPQAMALWQEFQAAGNGPGSDIKKQQILQKAQQFHDDLNQRYPQFAKQEQVTPEHLKQVAEAWPEYQKKQMQENAPTEYGKIIRERDKHAVGSKEWKEYEARRLHMTEFPPQIQLVSGPSGELGVLSAPKTPGEKPKISPVPNSEGWAKSGAGELGSAIPEKNADLHGEEFLNTLPNGAREQVKAIAEGRMKLSDLGIRGPARERLAQWVTQYDPNYSSQDYGTKAAVRKDFTSGKTATNITAINTALGHMGTMGELAEALKNKDTRILNAVINRVATETGNANVNNFETARQAVGDELMRVFRVVGASQHEAEAWQQRFSNANSPEQLRGALKVGAELLKSRIDAVNDQWRRGMGTEEDFPGLLSDKSKKTLGMFGIGKKQEEGALTGKKARAEDFFTK